MHSNHKIVEDLFRKYYKILRAYALRLVNDRDVAEDITQDVYYELCKRQEELTLDSEIKYYLFRSVYTKVLNYLNSKAHTEHESLEQTTESKIQQIYLQSWQQNQESDLFFKELQTEINIIVNSLPEQCRRVFLLSRKSGLKNREIADQLGISVKAVEKHISKALALLRLRLKDVGIILLLPLFF